ncbi:hypothetical protein JM946_24070 [Steroidobacter sp. S1-65]|uniref:Uncharacterized protein n=1 Tax=Steroidobacter gossypii TaxID=2805490 RepID=A0ABS1X3M2_9GAMM|nr:hypothetical protein [Steroidobacter gossypii]MBM0107823.1 hypothetical protein [Steroidobacter gossypii]
MTDITFLFQSLDALIAKYRLLSFADWKERFDSGEQLHDYAECNEASERWWQAHTDVLEIENDEDGRQYALVAVTIYPSGVHSSPPAPSTRLKVYEDGTVMGAWADGSRFSWLQHVG